MVPCPPVTCPGDQVTFTGTATALVGNNLWVLPNGSCSSSTTPDSIVLPQTAGACRNVTMTCGPYTATNVDPGPSTPCLTSTLTVKVNTSMTSSLIMVGTRSVIGQNTIVNTTQIIVIGTNVTMFTCVRSQHISTPMCYLTTVMTCVCLCNIFSSSWTSKCYGTNLWSRHGTSGGDPLPQWWSYHKLQCHHQ